MQNVKDWVSSICSSGTKIIGLLVVTCLVLSAFVLSKVNAVQQQALSFREVYEAQQFIHDKDYTKASEHLKNAVDHLPKNLRTTAYIALDHLQRNDPDGAAKALSRFLLDFNQELTMSQEKAKKFLPVFIIIPLLIFLAFWFWNSRVYTQLSSGLVEPLTELKNALLKLEESKPDELQFKSVKVEELSSMQNSIREFSLRSNDRTMSQATSERLATLSDMSLSLANSISSPLATISGYAQQMEQSVDSPDPVLLKKNAAKTMQAVDKIRKMTEALLSFNQSPETKSQQKFKISDAINGAIAWFGGQLTSSGVVLKVDVPNDLQVVGNITQIEQAIYHFISNARDAMDQAGGEVEVRALERVDEAQKKSFIDISVIDPGPGVSADMEKKIWDPFFTTKDKTAGSGLGLAVVKQIASVHGGQISYKREDNKTHFSISILKS